MNPMEQDLAGQGLRHVFVRDLVLDASIGIHAHEHRGHQRVRINIDLGVIDEGEDARAAGREDLSQVVDYQRVAEAARSIVRGGHIRLAETLAERIAQTCLLLDPRIRVVKIKIEKLDVFADAAAAGVAIVRRSDKFHPPSPVSSIDSQ
jgi:dihydroneopterin aldolase